MKFKIFVDNICAWKLKEKELSFTLRAAFYLDIYYENEAFFHVFFYI